MQLMSHYLIQLCFFLEIYMVRSQVWTWLNGGRMIDQITDGKGHPGGRSGSGTWSDTDNDTVWIFGGNGFSDLSSETPHVLNDVWQFSKSTKRFYLQHPGTWTSKSDQSLTESAVPAGRKHAAFCGAKETLVVFGGFDEGGNALKDTWVYNVKKKEWSEVFSNCDEHEHSCGPDPRGHTAVWCYGSFMYIFGGLNNNNTLFNDMWRLNLSSLTWTQLHSTEFSSGIYPTSRSGAATWVSSDVFYLFGGNINPLFAFTFQITSNLASDLWQYNPVSDRWTLVAGPSQFGQHGNYETFGKTAFANAPGCRIGAAAWTDSHGNLWLFGGAGADVSTSSEHSVSKLLSDVWRFHLGVKCWAFMDGSDIGGRKGSYKGLGERTEEGQPGGRTEALVWTGNKNVVYLFGGLGHDAMHHDGYLNDLWSLDVDRIVSRAYEISPVIFYIFVGGSTVLLSLVLLIALCTRQNRKTGSMKQRLDPNVKYFRLEMDEC